MKKYLKILLITLVIQLGGLAVDYLVTNLGSESLKLSVLGTTVLLLSIIAAIITDIVLAIRWGETIWKKLIYIVLMPTNYLWVVTLLWALWYLSKWVEGLTQIFP